MYKKLKVKSSELTVGTWIRFSCGSGELRIGVVEYDLEMSRLDVYEKVMTNIGPVSMDRVLEYRTPSGRVVRVDCISDVECGYSDQIRNAKQKLKISSDIPIGAGNRSNANEEGVL